LRNEFLQEFTVDGWQTISEVAAEYKRPENIEGAYDRFGFTIALPAQAEAMTVTICVRYQVAGQEFWDSNSGKNYFINIIPERQ
jgi:Carbohydrate/starch-binding module (family 21)